MGNDSRETRIDLLRHGEPVGGRRYRGHTDDPLSERGWKQMRDAVAGLNEWDVIYSSPLKRCAAFAEELAARLERPLRIDERLMEIGFGVWEGHTPEELMRDDPDCIERFWRDPVVHRPHGAEPIASFHARVHAAWQNILDANAGGRVLLVGHAGITRMVLSLALGSPPEHMFRVQVDNAGMTRVRVRGHGAERLPLLEFHGRGPR